jgi:hypothetical protein
MLIISILLFMIFLAIVNKELCLGVIRLLMKITLAAIGLFIIVALGFWARYHT